jgi:anaerobic selenocysteine-containing dehydrogenase
LTASARSLPWLRGVTLARLKSEGALPIELDDPTPFADNRFPTPSGKVELYSQALADAGADPLPGRFADVDDDGGVPVGDAEWPAEEALQLLTAASHHFVSSSFANHPGLLKNEGLAFVEIHPEDAERRGIQSGDLVVVANGRGWCRLSAVVTDAVRPGVVVSPKGRWAKRNGGRNVNWTTSDVLADLGGQSTFHSNRVWVKRAGSEGV